MFHARVSTTDPKYSYQTRHKGKRLLICWEATVTLETLSVMVKDCLGLIRKLIQLVQASHSVASVLNLTFLRLSFYLLKILIGWRNGTAGTAFLPVNFSGVSRFGRKGELTMLTGRWDIRVRKKNFIYCCGGNAGYEFVKYENYDIVIRVSQYYGCMIVTSF